jgi:hypothetical protein
VTQVYVAESDADSTVGEVNLGLETRVHLFHFRILVAERSWNHVCFTSDRSQLLRSVKSIVPLLEELLVLNRHATIVQQATSDL